MYPRFISQIRSALVAAVLSVGIVAPVAADGSLAIRLDPRTQAEADGIRLALSLYGLHRDIRSGAGVTQRGLNNLARIGQSGSGNFGVIGQRGNDHRGSLDQRGQGNAFGVFQSGRRTSADVRQSGGQTGLLFIHGW